MTQEEETDLIRRFREIEEKIRKIPDQLPSQADIKDLHFGIRGVFVQRWVAVGIIILFAGVTLGWLLMLSLCSSSHSGTWLGFVESLAPALIWLGVGAVIMRWLRIIR